MLLTTASLCNYTLYDINNNALLRQAATCQAYQHIVFLDLFLHFITTLYNIYIMIYAVMRRLRGHTFDNVSLSQFTASTGIIHPAREAGLVVRKTKHRNIS